MGHEKSDKTDGNHARRDSLLSSFRLHLTEDGVTLAIKTGGISEGKSTFLQANQRNVISQKKINSTLYVIYRTMAYNIKVRLVNYFFSEVIMNELFKLGLMIGAAYAVAQDQQ